MQLGGLSWSVFLGRIDGAASVADEVNSSLPFRTDNFSQLVATFAKVGLDTKDMIILSGVLPQSFEILPSYIRSYQSTVTCPDFWLLAKHALPWTIEESVRKQVTRFYFFPEVISGLEESGKSSICKIRQSCNAVSCVSSCRRALYRTTALRRILRASVGL